MYRIVNRNYRIPESLDRAIARYSRESGLRKEKIIQSALELYFANLSFRKAARETPPTELLKEKL